MSSKEAVSQAKETSHTPDVLQKRFTTLSLEDNSTASCVSFPNIPLKSSAPGPLVVFPGFPGSRSQIHTVDFFAGSNNFIMKGNAALGREASGCSCQGLSFFPPHQAQTNPEGLGNFWLPPEINMRSEVDQSVSSDMFSSLVSKNGLLLKRINEIDQTCNDNQSTSEGRPGKSRDNKRRKIGKPQFVAPKVGVSSLKCYLSRRHPSTMGLVRSSIRPARNLRHSPVGGRRPRFIAESQVVPDDVMPSNEKLMYRRYVQHIKFRRRILNQNPGVSQASIPIVVRASGSNSNESRAYAWDGHRSFFSKYFDR